MGRVVGVDVGGTFTDCVVVDSGSQLHIAKALTTHEDLSVGFFDALAAVAEKMRIPTAEMLHSVEYIFHGTTVGTNAVLERKGVKVGLLTTRGAGDSLLIMRAHGRVAGLPVDEIVHASATNPPEPLVPRRLIREINERVDSQGTEVVKLDEGEVERAVTELVSTGVQAVAVSFLWSFLNPAHELQARAAIERLAPQLYVACSHEVVAKWGEYERTAATVINCYIAPVIREYMEHLGKQLGDRGYAKPFFFLECTGGAMSRSEVAGSALLTIDSGPAAGLTGCSYLAQLSEHPNVICTDMGGTSFDVGLIVGGVPVSTDLVVLRQYEFYLPRLDIRSIGAGGGSYIHTDTVSGTLKVGPQSAGSRPGPVCYGLGGTTPTVTDADLVLGYINPDYFLGGRLKLNREAAEASLESVGDTLGMSSMEVAAGASKVVDARMADLIRQLTIQQGRDSREFTLYAYGGAGPVHAGAYARELGCATVVIPIGGLSSVWSAFGAAASDIVKVSEMTDVQIAPFSPERINRGFDHMVRAARQKLRNAGMDEATIRFEYGADLRYRGQVYEVYVPIPGVPCTGGDLQDLIERFTKRYEELYGAGSGFPAAGIELVNLKVRAAIQLTKPDLRPHPSPKRTPLQAAVAQPRLCYWTELSSAVSTPVYWGEQLRSGDTIEGPAIIDLPETTITIRPTDTATLDGFGSVVLTLGSHPSARRPLAQPVRGSRGV